MSLLPLFQWMENLPISNAIRLSTYSSAIINLGHLLVLVVFIGSVLVVDLRLLGTGMKDRPLADVARDSRPWMMWSFAGLVVTGVPYMITYAMKQYYSPYFWFKMEVLIVAVIFTLTIRHRVTLADEAKIGPFWGRLVAIVSIALWIAVIVPARYIGLTQ
jgi:hypothetical protein